MTKKQIEVIRKNAQSDTGNAIFSLLLELDYSMDLLTDYRNDLRDTAKDVTKEIVKATAKKKKLIAKYEQVAGRKYNPRKR